MKKTWGHAARTLAILFAVFLVSGCERNTDLSQAETLHDEGVRHYENGDYHLGVKSLRTAFDMRRLHLGMVDSSTLKSAGFLLACLDSNGEDQEALSLATEYLAEIEQLVGRESVEYARIEALRGGAQADLEEFEEAIKSLRHAKDVYVTIKGERDEASFLAMHNLNYTLARAGYAEEAIAGEEKLLELRKEVLGPRHRETIKSMTNLAFALSKQDNNERARELHEESLKLRKEVFGKDHPETYVEVVNLAVTYSDLKRDEEAITLAREGYEFFKGYYPVGHPDIRWSALNLRNILNPAEDKEERARLTEEYGLD